MDETGETTDLAPDEVGRIVVSIRAGGDYTFEIAGAIGAVTLWGVAQLIKTHGDAFFGQAMMEQQKRAQAGGLVVARGIPRDHQRKGRGD